MTAQRGESRYSSTLSLTSALDGVDGQRHAPAALPPGMTRYALYRKLGRPQGRSGQVLKISPALGFDPRTVQLVASRYTHYGVVSNVHKNAEHSLSSSGINAAS